MTTRRTVLGGLAVATAGGRQAMAQSPEGVFLEPGRAGWNRLAIRLDRESGSRIGVGVKSEPGRGHAQADFALVRYDSGGALIDAVMFTPADAGAATGAMAGMGVVLLHGSGGAQDDARIFTEGAMALASRGCRCLMPNYYDATPRQQRASAAARRQWRRAIMDGIAWMKTQPGVDAGRVGALGFSRGGGLVMDGALRFGGPAAVVGVAAAASTEPRDIRHRPPMLLIWSDDDPVVPAEAVRAWEGRLREAEVPVETARLDSPRHRFDAAEWRAIFTTAGAFFERAMGPTP